MAPSAPSGNEKMFPAAILEDQEAVVNKQMEPITFGPPPFSSSDPATDGNRMVSLGGEMGQVPDEEKKATDWVAAVKEAGTQEDLDAVGQRYLDSGQTYKSVEDAIEKKQDEIDNAGNDQNQ